MIRFGPSGNSESFYEQGYKSSVQMPGWLKAMGLNAYEYQCNKGVKISEPTAKKLGEEAAENGVYLSIHAPYYINMGSPEKDKRDNSIRYVLESMQAAVWMGAKRVVVHMGSCGRQARNKALETTIKVIEEILEQTKNSPFSDVFICPETLGKINQLGSFEEVLKVCRMSERLIPAIDFGHLYARSYGCLNSVADFEAILNTIENTLGYDRLKILHCHFSRVEYTQGGEKRHWTLDDVQYGPEFELLAHAILKKGIEPVIICESRNYMAEDALKLKKIYESIAKEGRLLK